MKIAVFSNYSWACATLDAAKRYFAPEKITLFAKNSADLPDAGELGCAVFRRQGADRSVFRALRLLRRGDFDTAVIDHGFSFDIPLIIIISGLRRVFMADMSGAGTVRRLSIPELLRLWAGKTPYFLNKMMMAASRRLKLSGSLSLPSEIYIETTTACNLRCKGCPTGLGQLSRPPMHIPAAFFGEIVNRNKMNFRYFDTIYPFLFGEPLINKDIFAYLKLLRSASRPYTRIEIHTNGNIAEPEKAATLLLEAGVDMVRISLDGTDKSSYESFRVGGNYDNVCAFVKALTGAKRRSGALRPEIVLQMVVTKYTQDQTAGFRRLKETLGADRLIFKDFFHEFTQLSDKDASSMAPSKDGLGLRKEEKQDIIKRKANRCGWVYRTVCILCNGQVSPCCIDSNAELLKDISVKGRSINEIWNSAPYREMRAKLLRGEIPMCSRCFMS